MRVLGGMIGLAGMALATAAIAAPNLNLICDGTDMTARGAAPKKTTKFHEVYRIDFETKRWCSGTCANVLPIVSVSDEHIVLMHFGGAGLMLDRINGTVDGYASLDFGNGNVVNQSFTGACRPQPFTGLTPPPKGLPKF